MSDEEQIDALIVATEDDKVRWRRHIFYTDCWVTSGLPRWRLKKGPFGGWCLYRKDHDGPTGVRRIRLWGRASELLAAVDARVARQQDEAAHMDDVFRRMRAADASTEEYRALLDEVNRLLDPAP